MKNLLLLTVSFLCSIQTLSADTRAGTLLAALSQKVRSMPGYTVGFEVRTADRLIPGRYVVRGDAYYMTFGSAEVFCDGRTRWEVNPEKKEVVIDAVDLSSRNILNNPTRAFDLADGGFSHELLGESGGKAVIRLVPTSADTGITIVMLTIDTSTSLPVSVGYDLDDERVEVTISSFRPVNQPPGSFHESDYPGYELIDFR